MVPKELSPRVRRFLEDYVTRVEQLEVLLFLHRHAQRSWTAREVADASALPAPVVAQQLENLGRARLLDVRLGSDVRYRYHPVTSDLRALVADVAAAYHAHRAPMVRLLVGRHATR